MYFGKAGVDKVSLGGMSPIWGHTIDTGVFSFYSHLAVYSYSSDSHAARAAF